MDRVIWNTKYKRMFILRETSEGHGFFNYSQNKYYCHDSQISGFSMMKTNALKVFPWGFQWVE